MTTIHPTCLNLEGAHTCIAFCSIGVDFGHAFIKNTQTGHYSMRFETSLSTHVGSPCEAAHLNAHTESYLLSSQTPHSDQISQSCMLIQSHQYI